MKLDLGIFSRTRVELVTQTELAECGLACLSMIAGYHGLNLDMSSLRLRYATSTRGLTLQSLIAIADHLGLSSRAVRVDLEDLGSLALPAILHWDMTHYVVLEAVSGKKVLVHNPAGKSGWMRVEAVSPHFTGVALELEPTAGFEAGDFRQRLRLSSLWASIRGLKRAVAQTVALSLVLQLFTLVSPYYLQLAIDSALPESNTGFLGILALGFGLFAVLNGVASLLRQSVLLAVGSSFGYGLSSNVARKLFRLPVDWFSRRHVGDILSRFQSVVPIRRMLAEDAPATLVDGALALFTLLLMLMYSPTLSMIAVSTMGKRPARAVCIMRNGSGKISTVLRSLDD